MSTNVSQEEFIEKVVKEFEYIWSGGFPYESNQFGENQRQMQIKWLREKLTLALQHGEAIGREKAIEGILFFSSGEVKEAIEAYRIRIKQAEALHTEV